MVIVVTKFQNRLVTVRRSSSAFPRQNCFLWLSGALLHCPTIFRVHRPFSLASVPTSGRRPGLPLSVGSCAEPSAGLSLGVGSYAGTSTGRSLGVGSYTGTSTGRSLGVGTYAGTSTSRSLGVGSYPGTSTGLSLGVGSYAGTSVRLGWFAGHGSRLRTLRRSSWPKFNGHLHPKRTL